MGRGVLAYLTGASPDSFHSSLAHGLWEGGYLCLLFAPISPFPRTACVACTQLLFNKRPLED